MTKAWKALRFAAPIICSGFVALVASQSVSATTISIFGNLNPGTSLSGTADTVSFDLASQLGVQAYVVNSASISLSFSQAPWPGERFRTETVRDYVAPVITYDQFPVRHYSDTVNVYDVTYIYQPRTTVYYYLGSDTGTATYQHTQSQNVTTLLSSTQNRDQQYYGFSDHNLTSCPSDGYCNPIVYNSCFIVCSDYTLPGGRAYLDTTVNRYQSSFIESPIGWLNQSLLVGQSNRDLLARQGSLTANITVGDDTGSVDTVFLDSATMTVDYSIIPPTIAPVDSQPSTNPQGGNVPEPPAVALMLLSLGAMAFTRSRSRNLVR